MKQSRLLLLPLLTWPLLPPHQRYTTVVRTWRAANVDHGRVWRHRYGCPDRRNPPVLDQYRTAAEFAAVAEKYEGVLQHERGVRSKGGRNGFSEGWAGIRLAGTGFIRIIVHACIKLSQSGSTPKMKNVSHAITVCVSSKKKKK